MKNVSKGKCLSNKYESLSGAHKAHAWQKTFDVMLEHLPSCLRFLTLGWVEFFVKHPPQHQQPLERLLCTSLRPTRIFDMATFTARSKSNAISCINRYLIPPLTPRPQSTRHTCARRDLQLPGLRAPPSRPLPLRDHCRPQPLLSK